MKDDQLIKIICLIILQMQTHFVWYNISISSHLYILSLEDKYFSSIIVKLVKLSPSTKVQINKVEILVLQYTKSLMNLQALVKGKQFPIFQFKENKSKNWRQIRINNLQYIQTFNVKLHSFPKLMEVYKVSVKILFKQ